MDSIAQRCKTHPRANKSHSGHLDAEALQHLGHLHHAIKSVRRCTNEADNRAASNASKQQLESAKCECMSACLKAISSKGVEPDAILEAANVFVEKISSTYTAKDDSRVNTFREHAKRCMNGYEDRRDCQDRRGRRGRRGCQDRGRPERGSTSGKGEKEDSDFPICTGEGVELFNIHTNLQTVIEIQVLLSQVILRAESAPQDTARDSKTDVKPAPASPVAASSPAGAETAGVGINRSGTDSTSRRETGGGSNQGVEETKSAHENGVAGTGRDGEVGSTTSNADQLHHSLSDSPPPLSVAQGDAVASTRALECEDILSCLEQFVDQDQYLFIALASKAFRRAWGPRATRTRPVVADTSIRQLAQCLEVGLPYDVRQRRVCSAAARLGKPGLLEFAKANRCGWTPATCAQAARGGHLRILKRLRAQGCGWDANTCRQAAMGGHLKVLKWARSNWFGWLPGPNVCPWDEGACAGAAQGGLLDVLKWLRKHGCPWNSSTCASAARGGHFEVLVWARINGCTFDSDCCFWAARRGDMGMLQWLRERNCPWDLYGSWNVWTGGGPCAGAARGGHLNIVKWASRNGCQWDKRTCDLAAQGGHLKVLKWAIENGCVWDSNTFVGAAWGGNLEVLRWARANGCPWDTRSCSIAARRGHLKVLQWLRGNGCPWDAQTTMKAAERGHHEVLIWALDNHGVWDSRIPLIADSNGYRYISWWARGYDRATHKRRFSLISKCEPWLGV